MRSFILVLASIGVMGLAFWAYRENYHTQRELSDLHDLQAEVGDLRESLSVLRAEWAYLNRPDRLRELADINFQSLGLLPLQPEQFGEVSQVSYPVAKPAAADPDTMVGDATATPEAQDDTP